MVGLMEFSTVAGMVVTRELLTVAKLVIAMVAMLVIAMDQKWDVSMVIALVV